MQCIAFIRIPAIVAIVAITGALQAQPQPAPAAAADKSPHAADEKAIREASQALARAFEKADAKAVAACWTEEGEYQDEENDPVRGRAALEKAYGAFFSTHPELKVTGTSDAIRFLGKDTALEEGTFTVRNKDNPSKMSRYSALYARQDGKWLIGLLKEWDDVEASRPKLDDLAWIIGNWKSDAGDVEAQTTYEWTENKKFIRCKYTVSNKKDKAAPGSGTQMIGVDPASGSIHAWTFDSEGGIGDARWVYDGQRWEIHSAGTLPDGQDTTALNLLTRSGNDEFTWRSVKRTINGEDLPDLAGIKVKRVK